MTYSFPQFRTEIVDPTITINPIVKEINPIDMTISVDVKLETETASFGIMLEKVKVNNLTYTSETLTQRVVEALEQYAVK